MSLEDVIKIFNISARCCINERTGQPNNAVPLKGKTLYACDKEDVKCDYAVEGYTVYCAYNRILEGLKDVYK